MCRAPSKKATNGWKSAPSTALTFTERRGRRWADFEDCLVDVCAEKVKADFLLTRDEKGFAQAHVPVMSPGDFFNYIESEYQITYDIVDLSEEAD